MIVSEEDQIILDKLWRFAKSEHFAKVYENIVQEENFVNKIVQNIAPMETLSPFREFSSNDIAMQSEFFGAESHRLSIVAELKNLIEVLESSANPYSQETKSSIHDRLVTIKTQLSWL